MYWEAKCNQINDLRVRVLEPGKLSFAGNKISKRWPPRNLAFITFGELQILFSVMRKFALFNGRNVFSSVSEKSKLFTEIFP